ncbi:MAG TPA: hypothetical protein VFR55_13170 [Dehalococcoidia bacterium]|nr:hypothetical protein [Dehalococcoidia bacterium]
MIWLKECPKCQGDLILDQDHYGRFKTCVQCGYLRDVVATAVSVSPAATATNGAMRGQLAPMPEAA